MLRHSAQWTPTIFLTLAGTGTKQRSASTQAPAKSKAATLDQLDEDLDDTADAVGLVNSVLETHPLSRRPPAEVPHQDHAPASTDSSNAQHGIVATASSQVQALCQPEKWPTPKLTEWQDVELVASL